MRIEGTNLPDNKRVEIALTYLYGIGKTTAEKILEKVKIPEGKKTKDLTQNEENKLREALGKYKIEAELKREERGNIKRLEDIKCYRGIRHIKKLPVRGQKTKTNSRSARPYRGRKTMTSGRRKLEKK